MKEGLALFVDGVIEEAVTPKRIRQVNKETNICVIYNFYAMAIIKGRTSFSLRKIHGFRGLFC